MLVWVQLITVTVILSTAIGDTDLSGIYICIYIQGVQLKSGMYLVFTKKYPFVRLISAKICGEIM